MFVRQLVLLVALLLMVPGPTLGSKGEAAPNTPGFLLIEIDGLSRPRLQQAFDQGDMPFLAERVAGGSHVAGTWQTIGSSTTPVSQAGILHGDSSGVPGYRWWDRASGTLVEASDSDDARGIELAASGGHDLLADGGASITNVVSGGAERALFTVSRMSPTRIARDAIGHLFDPPRAAGFVVGLADATLDALRHRLTREAAAIEPAAKRKVALPILGPALESALVDVTTMAVVREIERGTPVLYASLLPYDEVAHYAGPGHPVASDALRRIDAALATIHSATDSATRPYHLIVLSDHGQTPGRPFEERFGATLEDVVRAGTTPATDPIVAGSGNLAHVYLSRTGERHSLERIEAAQPGLAGYLVAHPGIGLVVVRTETGRLLALGPDGRHDLSSGQVDGIDPLLPYGQYAADSLRHIATPEVAGDLVVISAYDPAAGEVLPFERQVSSHGGLGGPQTEAILVYPAALEPDSGTLALVGAEAVGAKIREWMGASTGPQAAAHS